jgi:hypothetical protein
MEGFLRQAPDEGCLRMGGSCKHFFTKSTQEQQRDDWTKGTMPHFFSGLRLFKNRKAIFKGLRVESRNTCLLTLMQESLGSGRFAASELGKGHVRIL